MNAHRVKLEAVLLTAYFGWLAATIAGFAAVRPLWYDELFTLHLARVASPSDLLRHLSDGVDLNPPLLYFCTRASILTFGEAPWAVRLPALLGMLLGMGCFHAFIRRSRGPGVALLAVAASVASVNVWMFFIEARPYGLVFGFAGLLLVSWQRRWLWLTALACILGVSSHYYFVMPIAAVGLTELARQAWRKTLDVKPVLALGLGAVTLLAWYPLWSVAPRDYAAGFWAKVTFTRQVVDQAYWQFGEASLVLPVLIALAVAILLGERNTVPETKPTSRADLLALVLLAATPFAAVYLGAKVTGGLHYRYVLPAVFGFAGLFAIGIDRAARGHFAASLLGFVAFAALGLPYGQKPYREFFRYESNTITEQKTFLGDQSHGGWVIIETGYDFGRHWSANAGTYQPFFLADPEIAFKYNKVDTTERALQKLKNVTPVPALTVDEAMAELKSGTVFYYYGPGTAWGYNELTARGVRFEKLSEQGVNKFYRLKIER